MSPRAKKVPAPQPPKLNELAVRIDAHLKRFEADPKINAPRPTYGETRPYYGAGARYIGGAKISVRYVSYQGTSKLTRDEATRYLAKLDADFVGRHQEALREES